ncbi:MAG: hypothetical protein GTO04_12300, partial [Planctomycetales bacterium]|nr:hypothetical protein [Planctomycetales bacterium]
PTLFNNSVALQYLQQSPTTLELLDPAGNPLAVADPERLLDEDALTIRQFTASTTGTYHAQVSTRGPYELLVTRGADFRVVGNDHPAAAQVIAGNGPVIGHYDPSASDAEAIDIFKLLLDGESFRWDIQRAGWIGSGSNRAFDGAAQLAGFSQNSSDGFVEDQGREVIIDPANVSQGVRGGSGSVQVLRKIFVSPDEGFARYLDIITNPAATNVDYTYSLETELGTRGSAQNTSTSSGDAELDTGDAWLVTDTGVFGEPPVTQVIGGAGGALSPSAAQLDSFGDTRWSYQLSLGPGETQIVMHFLAQSASFEKGLQKAVDLAAPGPTALAGMSGLEKQQVVNFALPGAD